VLLGLAQIDLLLKQPQRREDADLAVVRLSAEAAVNLDKRQSKRATVVTRTTVEARYVEAMSFFLQGRYQAALSSFRPVLAFNNARLLPRWLFAQALENAAAAAMALGEDEIAREYFAQIPAQCLTGETINVMRALESKPKQNILEKEF
jgi:tetratricopeptide (TPR) repeat protein